MVRNGAQRIMKEFLLEWDICSYSRFMYNTPHTSVDYIRNCMALGQNHHTSSADDGVSDRIHTIRVFVVDCSKVGE